MAGTGELVLALLGAYISVLGALILWTRKYPVPGKDLLPAHVYSSKKLYETGIFLLGVGLILTGSISAITSLLMGLDIGLLAIVVGLVGSTMASILAPVLLAERYVIDEEIGDEDRAELEIITPLPPITRTFIIVMFILQLLASISLLIPLSAFDKTAVYALVLLTESLPVIITLLALFRPESFAYVGSRPGMYRKITIFYSIGTNLLPLGIALIVTRFLVPGIVLILSSVLIILVTNQSMVHGSCSQE
ncbi:MAG: hypothetical protein F7C36_06845 [Desulfurococcales archaeon]|nr:hypothetical protein [Desulfurococcales archaeon]